MPTESASDLLYEQKKSGFVNSQNPIPSHQALQSPHVATCGLWGQGLDGRRLGATHGL
jgi:hypothetical protein